MRRLPGKKNQSHSVLEGTVAGIAPGGRGLVRDPDGVVFVRGALPGERVRIEVVRAQRGVRHGFALEILDRSPDRIDADCPLHGARQGACGGCDLLELRPDAARRVRTAIVEDVLRRVARFDASTVTRALRPLVSAPDGGADALRRRARFILQGGRPTFSSPESHARVVVERCPALHPALQAALPLIAAAGLRNGIALRLACDDRGHVSAALEGAAPGDALRLVEAGAVTGALSLRGEHHEDDEDVDIVVTETAGAPLLEGEIAPGFRAAAGPCRSDAGVFSQATRFGARAILDAVVAAARPAPGLRVLELFAGSGHLTVPLLAAGAIVDAVEGAPRAVAFLEENTAHHRERRTVRRAFINEHLPLGATDVVVADPPRTGIPGFAPLLTRLRAAGARRLVLVSCDPATGARDLALAVAAGFPLENVTPIDAFPRTSHVEWVAALSLP